MKKLLLLLLIFSQFLFYSCTEKCITECKPEKDETEIIVEKLAEIIEKNHPRTASIFIYDKEKNGWAFYAECDGYLLDPPFIRVCGDYYHLKNLAMYTISGGFKLYFNF